MAMPDHPADWRRALELLAGSAEGCTETLLGAHGFTGMQIDGLVEARLATSSTRTVRAGERPVEVTTVRITAAGRGLLDAERDHARPTPHHLERWTAEP